MELDQGGIYIDGLEVSKLGLAQLRNAMAIIPQVTHRHSHSSHPLSAGLFPTWCSSVQ